MMANPKVGARVRVRYARKKLERSSHVYHLHGKVGRVVIAGKGKPRNHLVEIDGVRFVVPCGNLVRVNDEKS